MKSLTHNSIVGGFEDSAFVTKVVFFDTIPSTNTVAAEQLRKGVAPEGTLIIANHQTAGKGRQGREWVAPEGTSLLFSLVVNPRLPSDKIPFLTILSGVATTKALNGLTSVGCVIKWPNDIIVEGLKIGGILTEAVFGNKHLSGVVIGIGINVFQTRDDFPEDLRPTASSLRIALDGKLSISRLEILKAIVDEFEGLYARFLRHGSTEIIDMWKRYSATVGKQILIRSGEKEIYATALNIEEDGGLVVRDGNGFSSKIYDSEIEFIRVAEKSQAKAKGRSRSDTD